jgi:protein-tyrosine phosphatase
MNRQKQHKLRTVLFLCTGNYYRSRFAEHYFNARAQARGLRWKADSRGLKLNPDNPGPISRQTLAWLMRHEISVPAPQRAPLPVCDEDFQLADLIIAVKEAEHRSLLEADFPRWASRVEFWHIHDQDCATAAEALPELIDRIENLIQRLRS